MSVWKGETKTVGREGERERGRERGRERERGGGWGGKRDIQRGTDRAEEVWTG